MLPLMQIHLLRMQFQAYITPRDREKQFKEYRDDHRDDSDGRRAARAEGRRACTSGARGSSLMRLPDEAFPAIRTAD